MPSNKMQEEIVNQMTRTEQDAQTIRQLKEQVERLRRELNEYIQAEKVMMAAGLIAEAKVKQAHDIVQNLV